MEITLPHRVEYEVTKPVSVSEIIGSLQANEQIANELGLLLEQLIDGLTVENVRLQVKDISTSSLREYFLLALVVAFQDELKKSVPPMVESLLGVDIPDKYDAIVTACVVLLLFYGAEQTVKRLGSALSSTALAEQINYLIADLSEATGTPESKIRRALEAQFSKPGKLRTLKRAAVNFFRPSRNQDNDPIVVGDRRIEPDVIQHVPKTLDEDDEDELTKPLPGVSVSIRAKDSDKDNVGWAGVVRVVSDKRLRMQLYPTVKREDLWDRDEVVGDVIMVYKRDGDDLRPTMFYLVNVHDGKAPSVPQDAASDTP